MNLLADWLQKDFILAGEQQALQADKVLLDQTKTGNYHYITFSPCTMADSQNARSLFIANKATVGMFAHRMSITEYRFMSGVTSL